MKAAIYYFSGTGNSKYIAEQMALYLKTLEYEVILKSIEEEIGDFDVDLLIIGGPIYAGNIPEKLIRWIIRNVPETSRSKAIVFTSSAGLLNAHGVTSMGDKLIKKNYDLIGSLTYEMPRNYYFDGYEKTPFDQVKKQITDLTGKIPEDLNRCLKLKPILIEEKVLKYDLLEEVMSLMTRFMGKNYSMSAACIQCGLCERSCPTKNIDLSKKKPYGLKCMMCTRCLHNCPVNAIEYKHIQQEQYKLKEILENL